MGPQERTEENERASGVRRRARERKRRAKRRTERAEASARSFPFRGRRGGRKGAGGANSRDINSVLALGGLHRRKLRAKGEYYPPFSVSPRDQHLSIPPSVVSLPPSPSSQPLFPPYPIPTRPPTQPPSVREVGEALQIRD